MTDIQAVLGAVALLVLILWADGKISTPKKKDE